MEKRLLITTILVFIFFAGGIFKTDAASSDVPRMTIEELKAMLGKSDLVVIDVRLGGDWTESHSKIKGAIREDPHAISSWVDKYPKNKTLVFY